MINSYYTILHVKEVEHVYYQYCPNLRGWYKTYYVYNVDNEIVGPMLIELCYTMHKDHELNKSILIKNMQYLADLYGFEEEELNEELTKVGVLPYCRELRLGCVSRDVLCTIFSNCLSVMSDVGSS